MRHVVKIAPFVLAFFVAVWLLWRWGSSELMIVFLSFAITVPIGYLVVDRQAQKNGLLRMKEEALRAELALLKSQINPHFFFNTLNNLYGLTKEQSELAPDMILKLSDLMRFVIYEGAKDRVPLRDEIDYLRNYLDLERIRVKELDLNFDVAVDDEELEIPPLLFIMLVENAFKHGAATQVSGARIHLRLRVEEGRLAFDVENTFETGENQGSKGIGLTNLRRRLALLYPDRHQFETRVGAGVYVASLRIEL